MNAQKRHEIFARLRAANPEPRTELLYESTYQLLVAVILSAQSTDRGVNIATRSLFKAAPAPAQMVALGLDGVESHVKTIGLYHNKAKNILATSQLLLDCHGGEVPGDRESLESLPGVGRKTANVVLNVAFGQPVMAVDTHIFRVSNRTRIAPGKTERAVEDRLVRFIAPEFMQHAHHWLILHGRYTCKARQPECFQCSISDLCEYRSKTAAPTEHPARRPNRPD
jgi:endonuclease-3